MSTSTIIVTTSAGIITANSHRPSQRMSKMSEYLEKLAMHLAAESINAVLTSKDIAYAFIGGYAVQTVGGQRYTKDIDLLVSVPVDQVKSVVWGALLEGDENFTETGTKLAFDASKIQGGLKIPIEVLSIGILNLPQRLKVCHRGNRRILCPSVLVLTKMKRYAHLIDSTSLDSARPSSVQKAKSDLEDITVLLRWLVDRNMEIDFVAYSAPNETLVSSMKQVVSFWKSSGKKVLLLMLQDCLSEADRASIM